LLKSPAVKLELMFWNWTWLKVLKDSNRSSNFIRSVRLMVLNKDMLKFTSPGPTTESLRALPNPLFGPPAQGATGAANEALVNQACGVFGYLTDATRSGRFVVPPPKPSTSGP